MKMLPGPTLTIRVAALPGGGVGVGCPPGVGVAVGGVTITGCVGADLLSPQAASKSIRAAVTTRSNERLMAYLQREIRKIGSPPGAPCRRPASAAGDLGAAKRRLSHFLGAVEVSFRFGSRGASTRRRRAGREREGPDRSAIPAAFP